MALKQKLSENNKATLLKNGTDAVDAHIKLVKEAKEKILFHTYIFHEDSITEDFYEALIEKASQGVKVFFIADAFGTPELSKELKKRMEKAGVNWAYFAPFFGKRFQHLGRRLHQKLLLIDNDKAITGGINLAKKFIDPEDANPWLDYSVLIEGEEVYRLQRKVKSLYVKHFPEHSNFLHSSINRKQFNFENPVKARTLVNDFMRFKTEVHRNYVDAIRKAEKSIKITATYFLPGKRLLKELKKASKRGVEIELIFGEVSDHPMERYSSRYLYSWYLNHGIKVYEWNKSILHAKAALIDDDWVSIGSYNHNYLSRYICLELNVELINKEFATKMDEQFSYIKENSTQVQKREWSKKTSWLRIAFYFITYTFSNFITLVATLFIVRKKEETESP
ncbi:MAG: hypothetical protein CME64_14165 [Halobacteriovoraceae bacterium]|nr:hypothetical protein [Halobacteriovoraceae bacterium]